MENNYINTNDIIDTPEPVKRPCKMGLISLILSAAAVILYFFSNATVSLSASIFSLDYDVADRWQVIIDFFPLATAIAGLCLGFKTGKAAKFAGVAALVFCGSYLLQDGLSLILAQLHFDGSNSVNLLRAFLRSVIFLAAAVIFTLLGVLAVRKYKESKLLLALGVAALCLAGYVCLQFSHQIGNCLFGLIYYK